MGYYPSQRFGQDSAPRISTTAVMLSESGELAPIPTYQPMVPFLPAGNGITSGSGVSTSSTATGGTPMWKSFPDRLDLYAYQGDDVQIPLYFQDPAQPDLDMSDYDWKGQTRVLHHYWSTLVNEFSVSAEFIPGDPEVNNGLGTTLVTLFLPRYHNDIIGAYQWDLHSLSPFVGPAFPKPPDVDDADWPPTTQLKTWLFGHFYIVPRVTATDSLPIPTNAVHAGELVIVTPTGTYGPNGRVP